MWHLHTPAVFFSACVLFSLLWAGSASGHDQEEVTVLEEVQVIGERPVSASSSRIILNEDILLQPQGRPADLLRLAPGLITLEHSGGAGKADQFLLRGFDADHGTDLALHVDGMPINMRSHAHGQGYGDINFIIPETIEEITVKKGTYHVEYGDFATAGAADYVTRESVPETIVQSAGGNFNTQRHLFITSPTQERFRTLFAGEFYYTDGPYDFGNRNTRYNGLAKLKFDPSATSQLSVTFTQYYGRWNGSGQIPLREVTSGGGWTVLVPLTPQRAASRYAAPVDWITITIYLAEGRHSPGCGLNIITCHCTATLRFILTIRSIVTALNRPTDDG